MKDEFPSLVYCSITGFGQTGPYSPRPGYDALVQVCRSVQIHRAFHEFSLILAFWIPGPLGISGSLDQWVPSLLPCQAMGGYMSVTGEPEGEPMKVGVPVHDLYAGLHGVP